MYINTIYELYWQCLMKEMFEEEDYFKHENTVIKFWSHLLKYVSSDLSFISTVVSSGVASWNTSGYFQFEIDNKNKLGPASINKHYCSINSVFVKRQGCGKYDSNVFAVDSNLFTLSKFTVKEIMSPFKVLSTLHTTSPETTDQSIRTSELPPLCD